MVAFNKFNAFVERLAEGGIDLDTNTIRILLSNTAPIAANSVVGDITEIAAGNGYSAGGIVITPTTSAQSGGLYTLDAADITAAWTASGGSIGPFQYFVLYDDTTNNLIGWWDYGTTITITSGNSLNITFSASGILTIQ